MRSFVTLKFLCPTTKGEIEYQVKADARILVERWRKSVRCKCPYCKSSHNFAFRAGYVDGAIAHIGLTDINMQAPDRFVSG